VFASRIPLSKRVMSSILVLAATQSVAHAQNLATVTVSPTTVDEGQPITISMTIDVSILNQLGAVQTDLHPGTFVKCVWEYYVVRNVNGRLIWVGPGFDGGYQPRNLHSDMQGVLYRDRRH